MLMMSESFTMGDGNLNHNLRITRGRGVRQNGKKERRAWNRYLDVDTALVEKCKRNKASCYEREAVKAALIPLVLDKLNAYNERQLRGRHSNRMLTFDEWLDKRTAAVQVKKTRKTDSVVSEYVVQIGDKTTGSTFEYECDEDGRPLDKNGNIISVWHTDKALVYRNGEVVMKNKHLPDVLEKFYQRFKEANPNFVPLGAFIHGDETAGWHMHVSGMWLSRANESIGIGLGETSGIKQQYTDRGIAVGNSRNNNAMTMWQSEMRSLLEQVCRENGIAKLDMECKRKHEDNQTFKRNQDRRARAMAEMEAEIVKGLDAKEAAIAKRETALTAREKTLSNRETELLNKEAAFLEKLNSAADVKPFLKHHYEVLQEMFPDYFRDVHAKVVELYGGKKKNGTVKTVERER